MDELFPSIVMCVVRSDSDNSFSPTPEFSEPRIRQTGFLFFIPFLSSAESIGMLEEVISSEIIKAFDFFSVVTSSTALSCCSKTTCFSVEREVLLIFEFGGVGVFPHRYNFSIASASHKRNRLPTFCGLDMSLAITFKGNFLFEAL